MTTYPIPPYQRPRTKTPVWAWITMGILGALLLIISALWALTLLALAANTQNSSTADPVATASATGVPGRVQLAASADGDATLYYTNTKGNETSVEFNDHIVVEAVVKDGVAGATVVKVDGSRGGVICSFGDIDGQETVKTQDQGTRDGMPYYMCFAAVAEK